MYPQEGLAASDRAIFMNGKNTLAVLDDSLRLLARNADVIPAALRAQGYNHMGDADYWEGQLLVPLERDSYTNATFAWVNASTLQMSVASAVQTAQAHMPWAVADANASLAYSSEFDNVTEILCYTLPGLSLAKRLQLRGAAPLMAVQGGAMWEGMLYLVSSDKATQQPLWRVDLGSGDVQLVMATATGMESEGLAFVELQAFGLGLMHFTANDGLVNGALWNYSPVH
jgi:hypothetical protein